jgi:hypothetical protein
LHCTLERARDSLFAAAQHRVVSVSDDYVKTGSGTYFGDAGAH